MASFDKAQERRPSNPMDIEVCSYQAILAMFFCLILSLTRLTLVKDQ
jgi:hypothetical protein